MYTAGRYTYEGYQSTFHMKADVTDEYFILFKKRIDGQVQHAYKDKFRWVNNYYRWYHPIHFMEDLAPPDSILVEKLNHWFEVLLY